MFFFGRNKLLNSRNLYITNIRALSLFVVQYSALIYLLVSGPVYPENIFLFVPYLSGLALGLWAIYAMGPANLNAAPDVLPGARLIKKGPYGLIRHPMYSAIMLTFIPLVISSPGLYRMLVLLILIANLFLKLGYEEKQLNHSISEYKSYSAKTWKLIPYLI